MLLAGLSSGGIAAIIIVVIAVIAAALIAVLVILKKKKSTGGASDCLNPTLNNSQLFERFKIENLKPNMVAIVPPTHTALVIKSGTVTDECSGGEVKLCDSDVKSVHSLEVLYISKTAKLPIRWGTQKGERVDYTDPLIKRSVSVGAYGELEIRVSNPKDFYEKLVVGDQTYLLDKLQERIRNKVVSGVMFEISQMLRSKGISYVDFNASKFEIQSQIEVALSQRFKDDGFEVCDLIIENINIPEEQERLINRKYDDMNEYAESRRRKELALADADLDDELYKRSLNREREQEEHERKMRHEDEDRAWARESKLIDNEHEENIKTIDAFKEVGVARSEAAKAQPEGIQNAGHHCSICGTAYKPGAKFCPSCGVTIPRDDIKTKCPGCGQEIPWGTAFCPVCGSKTGK